MADVLTYRSNGSKRPMRRHEMVIYAEKHDIFHLVLTLLSNVMVDKPEDPIQYLINFLKRDSFDGKAKKLCEHTQAIHVTFSDILKDDSDLSRAARQYQDKKQKIPKDLWSQLIQIKTRLSMCIIYALYFQGWVLEAIPKTQEEALYLQEAGITPDHVVMLEAPDVVLIERSSGQRIDPVTGDVYHVTFMWPESEEVAQRLETPSTLMPANLIAKKLQKFHTEAHAVKRTFHSCLKTINADQPHVDVFSQGKLHHLYLVWYQGHPSALKGYFYQKMKNLSFFCCGKLLKAVSADESHMGELIKPYLESEQQVPSSIVLQILTERLSRMDCTTRGWVLHGFPQDVEQAEELQESNFIPNRVFFLEITDDIAIERVALRVHCKFVYKESIPFNPRHSEAQLLKRLKEYWNHTADLQAFYPQAVYINAGQDPHTVFESLESRLVGRLPKVLSNRETSES
uniref:Adenylate kinase 8 n=1 Tax=Sinocyclocheilus anshuiensis TaxID=1608454 RepID=A0A671NZK4_9TELE